MNDSTLPLAKAFFLTVLFIVYSYFYLLKSDYKQGKNRANKSIMFFKFISPILIISTFAISLISLFWRPDFLLFLHDHSGLEALGFFICLTGALMFVAARLTLNKNYSPCYDIYLPHDIVLQGLYKYVRHPIYTANILLLFGLALATGSGVILINSLVLTYFYYRSAKNEEEELVRNFSDYTEYQKHVPMFFPTLNRQKEL